MNNRQNGSALLIVLWAVALISFLVAMTASTVGVQLREQRAQTETWKAQVGLRNALVAVKYDELRVQNSMVKVGNQEYVISFADTEESALYFPISRSQAEQILEVSRRARHHPDDESRGPATDIPERGLLTVGDAASLLQLSASEILCSVSQQETNGKLVEPQRVDIYARLPEPGDSAAAWPARVMTAKFTSSDQAKRYADQTMKLYSVASHIHCLF